MNYAHSIILQDNEIMDMNIVSFTPYMYTVSGTNFSEVRIQAFPLKILYLKCHLQNFFSCSALAPMY